METNMTTEKALDILERHNLWRRGADFVEATDPRLLGMALDKAIEVLRLSIVIDTVCIFCNEEKRMNDSFLCEKCINDYNKEKQTGR